MGWLWASPPPAKPSPPARQDPPRPAPSAAPDAPADAEVQKFLDLLRSDPTSSPPRHAPTPSSASSASSASTWSSWFARTFSSAQQPGPPPPPPPPPPPRDALSESLLPTEMSCRQAFDLAWSCNSLGGQFNAVYRHGSMRSCSGLWDDFWFCMRAKSYSGDLKCDMVRAHYRAKDLAKYGPGKPSSEDVWEGRGCKVQPGTAFADSVDAPLVGDDEWRRNEAQRRREIRQGLGFGDAS